MGRKDPRIDTYIARQADFARPILRKVRALVHRACPEVEEDIKWGFPHFLHRGMMCSMAAFKTHAAVGFWRPEIRARIGGQAAGMGQLGKLTDTAALPKGAVLLGWLREAAALNESTDVAPKVRRSRPALPVPADLKRALKASPAAAATFQRFPPSCRREYCAWILEARTAPTRSRRIAATVDALVAGRDRKGKSRP